MEISPLWKIMGWSYAHVINKLEERYFIRCVAFALFSKYNKGGISSVTVLVMNDDNVNTDENGRMAACKKEKIMKSQTTDISAGKNSPLCCSETFSWSKSISDKGGKFEVQQFREGFK